MDWLCNLLSILRLELSSSNFAKLGRIFFQTRGTEFATLSNLCGIKKTNSSFLGKIYKSLQKLTNNVHVFLVFIQQLDLDAQQASV